MSDEPFGDYPIRVEKAHLLLVEGKDEVVFFGALLRHMSIDVFQILDLAGKDRLPRMFPALYRQLDRLRVYAIIRDAEISLENTFKSILSVLKTHGEPCPRTNRAFASKPGFPRKVGVFVLPGDSDHGMLEDLCLCTVEDHPAMPCVSAFMDCIGKALPRKPPEVAVSESRPYYPKNPSKATAMAFLAAMHEEVHRVGEAAEKHYWDFEHSRLAALRDFLREMASF
jgi:hypothetical protein